MRTILWLAVNPKQTHPLRLDEEVRRIEQGLERSRHRENFRLVVKWAVTDDDLRRAMLDAEPQIVHFSGHGSGAEGGLIFEDHEGRPHEIAGESLARLFALHADKVECVLLNACHSEAQIDAIARHVRYVIGMSQEVGDAAAIKFALGFYDALGAGRTYEFAFLHGRCAVDLNGLAGREIPAMRVDGRVVAPPPTPQGAAPEPSAANQAVAASARGERRSVPVSARLDRKAVERAAESLAEELGPVAYLLAAEAARGADGLEQLYRKLSAEIPSPEGRRAFLARWPKG